MFFQINSLQLLSPLKEKGLRWNHIHPFPICDIPLSPRSFIASFQTVSLAGGTVQQSLKVPVTGKKREGYQKNTVNEGNLIFQIVAAAQLDLLFLRNIMNFPPFIDKKQENGRENALFFFAELFAFNLHMVAHRHSKNNFCSWTTVSSVCFCLALKGLKALAKILE